MLNHHTRVTDLTVEELAALIRNVLREELEQLKNEQTFDQTELVELPPLHVGQWPNGLNLLSRDEYYDNER